MKILIFSHEFPPQIGGAGVVAMQNARALSLIGHEITVLTRKRLNTIADGPYNIIEVPVFSKFWFLSYRKAVDFNSFDLIFLNDPASAYVAGLFFSSQIFSKSIIFLHGDTLGLVINKPKITHILSLFKPVYIKSLKRCKKLCAVSNYMKDIYISHKNLFDLQKKFFVDYAGTDLKLFFPENDKNFKMKWHIPEDAVILLSVSRIHKRKGYYDKFCIFKDLCKEDEKLYWIIIGEGEYLDTLKALAKENSLENRIIFTGAKRRKELRVFYSNADVFWLLSNCEDEAFGLTYIEAQACGIPVIGRNHAGVTEAISNGISGFLVDNDQQVKNIIKDKLYKKLSVSEIIAFSKKFDIEKNISTLIEKCIKV